MQMWANNTTAMLVYHGARVQTMALRPFTSPPATTNPTGMAAQSAAVTTAQAINLPTDPIFENPTIALLLVHEESVIQSGFPFNMISAFTGGHDFLPGQYPDVLAPTPRNLAIAYNVTGPEAVGGAANVFAAPAAATSAAEASYTASLGSGMYVGNLVVPPSAVTSPIQLMATQAPLVATAADGAPLIPAFVPPMPPGARKAQRDKPDEKGYGPPIPGTIMRRPPSGG
jgi:PPE-repeat protein